jgi:hypothetical protein
MSYIVLTGDIREMFLQVFDPDKDRDKLRFLLYVDGQLQVYRWNIHLFGKRDSPCVAMTAVFTTILKTKRIPGSL